MVIELEEMEGIQKIKQSLVQISSLRNRIIY